MGLQLQLIPMQTDSSPVNLSEQNNLSGKLSVPFAAPPRFRSPEGLKCALG